MEDTTMEVVLMVKKRLRHFGDCGSMYLSYISTSDSSTRGISTHLSSFLSRLKSEHNRGAPHRNLVGVLTYHLL